MNDLKIAIIYYSATGTNHQLAKWAEAAALQMGAEVKFLRITETAPSEAIQQNPDWQKHHEATKSLPPARLEDLEWADAIVFSVPTRYGNLPSQVSAFFDTTGSLWSKGKLANKVVTGMTSASNVHGGQETTLQSLYKTMHHWGAVVITPGYTNEILFEVGGNPYGTSVTAGQAFPEKIEQAVTHQIKRTIEFARWIKRGLLEKAQT
jgi:NAD(P)H dehydrogenase (quinone)